MLTSKYCFITETCTTGYGEFPDSNGVVKCQKCDSACDQVTSCSGSSDSDCCDATCQTCSAASSASACTACPDNKVLNYDVAGTSGTCEGML